MQVALVLKGGAEDGDIVMTSDADEIINPYVLEDTSWFNPDNHYVAVGNAYYYKLNFSVSR